jgi:hypothetical protein
MLLHGDDEDDPRGDVSLTELGGGVAIAAGGNAESKATELEQIINVPSKTTTTATATAGVTATTSVVSAISSTLTSPPTITTSTPMVGIHNVWNVSTNFQ